MNNKDKKREDLIKELKKLRQRVAELEASEARHKRVETELRKSEERFRVIAESTLGWIWEVDVKGRYTYASSVVERILGYKPEEMLKKCFYDLFHSEDQEKLKRAAFEVFSQKEIFREFINRNVHKDGTTVWFSTSGVPILDEKRNLIGYRGVDIDITTRRQAEEELRQSFKKLQKIMESTIYAIARIVEMRDPYTAGHQQRVANLSSAIAKEMNLPNDKIRGLYMAAVIHDIGKIYVPAEILSRPSRLTESELALVKTHPRVGYDILKTIEFPWPVANIVLQHHECLNGSGYPQGLKKGDILLEAKILVVSDVVEAMSSHRPYRPARGLEVTLEEISKEKDVLYDADIVDICLQLFEKKGFKFD